MLVGLTKIDQLADDGAFKVWQCRIVYRTFVNDRARKRPVPIPDDQLDNVVEIGAQREDPAEAAARRELGRRLDAAMDRLPAAQREAVWLVDGEGFLYAEAAEILGIRPGTAASRVLRGRAALRQGLARSAREQGVIR